MRKNVTLVCDLQFGSTGKGLIAGYLAEKEIKPDVVVTAWSANAGHTYIDSNGRKFVHCMLANGIVSPNLKHILIGPGSQIDPDKLWEEMESIRDYLGDRIVQVSIHPHACIIQQRHRDEEAGPMTKIGSTKKGCGAAMNEKIRRNPDGRIVAANALVGHPLASFVCTPNEYDYAVDSAKEILVEGAQGYSLGINSGFYPYVTSRECTPAQIMVDCGIPIKRLKRSIGACRTYPIRVANRYDEDGNMIGWSGPCYGDQEEISFADLGVKAEKTTVTQLTRRIFTFSDEQFFKAIRMTGVDEVFVNFMNYIDGEEEKADFLERVVGLASSYNAEVTYLGYGPTCDDVVAVGQIK